MDPKNVPPVEEYDNLDIPAGTSPQNGIPASQQPVTPYVVPPQSAQQEVPQPIQSPTGLVTPQGQAAPPPPDMPPVYEDSSKKKIFMIAGLFVFFFLIILGGAAFFMLSQNSQPTPPSVTDAPQATGSADLSGEPRLLPKVVFETWTNTATSAASTPSSYVLEIEQPSEEIGRELARKLGFGDIEFGEQSLTGSVETASESAMYMYEVNTGSMFYLAETGKQLNGPPSDETVMNFLQRFGVYDSSMSVFATYQKTSTPRVTYYEIHRDWEFVGLPILLDLGLVSIPESQPLDDLTQQNTPDVENEDIVSTSDGTDGYDRAEDFNTITVGVDDETGRVVYLFGNMRQIGSVQRDVPLISSEEAFALLQDGNYEQLIPIPAGEGDPGFTDVFPNEVTNGSEAVITDMIPAYLEKPIMEKQELIQPYWIFRGYSELESGYRIRFIASVPAQQPQTGSDAPQRGTETTPQVEETLQSSLIEQMIGIAYAGETQLFAQQQQESIPTNDPDPTPETVEELEPIEELQTEPPATEPTEAPSEEEQTDARDQIASGQVQCRFPVDSLKDIVVINGLTFGRAPGAAPNKPDFTDWYYVPDKNAADTIAFAKSVFETGQRLGASRIEKWVVKDVLTAIQNAKRSDNPVICPARVTGLSPSLFYYGTQQLTIRPLSDITYADPPLDAGIWYAKSDINGMLVNDIPRTYMYYEYNPSRVRFQSGPDGWVIARVALPYWVARLSSQLQLTDTESARLLFEIMDTAKSIHTDYISIQPIQMHEVDNKLPLQVQSIIPVTVHRYFFHVEPATVSEILTEPVLSPVTRSDEMILELGGYTTSR